MGETTRRTFLRAGAVAGGLAAATGGFGTTIQKALAATAPGQGTLDEVEHIVILMQENNSFDHYYGMLRGVRGFSDPDVLRQPNGKPVWYQWLWDSPDRTGYVIPNHLDTSTTSAQWVDGFGSNYWTAAHTGWNWGRMDQWVTLGQLAVGAQPLAKQAYSMSYYARQDIPFHYALADAFTICDGYHCSLLSETNGNRIMGLSGTIDPDGVMGGPAIDDSTTAGQLKWTSYPEQLEKAGVSWYVYQETDNDDNNMMTYFEGVANAPADSQLYQRANTFIPTPAGQPAGPALWAKLRADVEAGTLPQVSYILANNLQSEDSRPPGEAAYFIQQCLEALTANPDVWRKTVFFLTYDEHGGTFDHVVPPTSPPGTPGEWITEPFATPGQNTYFNTPGPIGLGIRVPMTVISPFTTGGYVCHDTFDHTSMIRFMEAKFGVRCENISAWRRKTVGDLTSTLGKATTTVFDFGSLPDGQQLAADAQAQKSLPAPAFPAKQVMPVQEPGTRPVIGAGTPPAQA